MRSSDTTARDLALAAREASRQLRRAGGRVKNAALAAVAEGLGARSEEILAANADDLAEGREKGLTSALLDRLALDARRLSGIAAAVRDVAALPDPVGEIVEGRRTEEGLRLERRRVPLGVLAVVYEARPNVTVDAAALALKSGNAVILRGGTGALRTNRVLARVVSEGLEAAGLPRDAVQLVGSTDRALLVDLVGLTGLVDLVIPRGGEGLKHFLLEHAKVPVVYAAGGNCHVYVDRAADLERAEAIIVNAKCQRPGVCNAAETLLVHRDVAEAFIPRAARALLDRGVTLYADDAARAAAGALGEEMTPATETHWATEFLALELAVRVVDDLDAALDHVARYGTGHSEAIVTEDVAAAERFTGEVDAAAVYLNASTRFTDGAVFGLGAEIGISTQKLHVRGPIGLRDLTTTQWVVTGRGHVR